MKIRFENTSTTLPIDENIEAIFHKTIVDDYKKAVERPEDQEHIDIFFVDKEELDRERNKLTKKDNKETKETKETEETEETEDNIDLLGIYIPKYSENSNLNTIKICPEKIKETCNSFKTRNSEFSQQYIYPTLLVAVVIHELAHALMCSSSEAKINPLPWEWLTQRQDVEPNYDFKSNHIYQECKDNWESDRHFIEESLANAFVLKQNTTSQELAFLEKFTAGQPAGYKQGDRWSGDLTATIETAETWKKFKSRVDHGKWCLVFYKNDSPTQNLVDSLESNDPEKAIASFDFMSEYRQHLAKHISARELQREQDKGDYSYYQLKSLADAQKIKEFPNPIDGNFNCSFNQLESLDRSPNLINGDFICNGNQIKSLKDIHLQIKEINSEIWLYNNPIASHILGLFLIKGLKRLNTVNDDGDFSRAAEIFNRHIKKGKAGLMECQAELIGAGLDDFAQV